MREMKDSGVEWIGNIPRDWNVLRNKNTFSCSKELVAENSKTTQLLSLTTKGIKEKDINNTEGKLPESFDTYQYVKTNDMVMCLFDLDCSAVFSGISPFNGMISPAYKILTCHDNMLPQYADYWFRYISDGRKFKHYAKNIRYTLNIDEFTSLPILVPNIKDQLHIADYLDYKCAKINSAIARQQEVIEKLKAYKLSVIDEQFANLSGISCHLGYISTFKNGLNFAAQSTGNEIKFLGVGDFKNNFILNNEEMFSSIIVDEEVTTDYLLKNGDIIFVRSNGSKELVGRSVMVENIDFPLTYSGFCIRFRNLQPEKVDNKYLLYFFRSPYFRMQLEKYSQGSNISNINQDLLSRITITFGTLKEQQQIADYLYKKCARIDKAIETKQFIIDKLTAYKKSLIYEVVTGKREV